MKSTFLSAFLFLLSACNLTPTKPAVYTVGAVSASPSASWDAVFTRTSGWTGGDGAYSISLEDGRTLWLFSDTIWGDVAEGKHQAGTVMLNNTIATHADATPGQAPKKTDLSFFHGPEDSKHAPTSWIQPAPHIEADRDASAGHWYWLGDGARLERGTARDRLVFFLNHIGRIEGDESVWAFESVGGALAVIENVSDPVDRWRPIQLDNPHAIGRAQAAREGRREISWGAAVHESGESLYIYGVREEASRFKTLLLAKAPVDGVEDFGRWRFWSSSGWSASLSDAELVAHDVVNELSVEAVNVGGDPLLMMVHSQPLLGSAILIRFAEHPEGPWTAPRPIYTVPEVAQETGRFTYAAKGHAHASDPDRVLISYVVNHMDFWAMLGDASIYRPRFVTFSLTALFESLNEQE